MNNLSTVRTAQMPSNPLQSAMNTDEIVREAVQRLVPAAHPQRVILFGSHARGDAGPDSDIDLLVIVNSEQDRRAETEYLEGRLMVLLAPDSPFVIRSRLRYPVLPSGNRVARPLRWQEGSAWRRAAILALR